jgi:hypothetical protein
VADLERLDPALLAEGQRDEVSEFDDLLITEVLVQPLHERVIDGARVPDELARVEQGRLLTIVEPIRALEFEQLVVVLL